MKVKPIILVIATLIIGFVLGMLTSAQIRNQRLKPVRVFFSEERFREGFYKTIQPDGQQKVKIELILDKYARLNSDLQNSFRRDLDESMKEFRKELDLNLTKDQIARLKTMDERRHQMERQNWKNHENDTINERNGRRYNQNGRSFPGGSPSHYERHDTISLPDHK